MSHVKTANDVIFWEPSLVLRGGFKNMKLQLQLTSSKAFKKDNFSTQEAVFALSTFFSLGVKKAK